jgi:hypothetical protein
MMRSRIITFVARILNLMHVNLHINLIFILNCIRKRKSFYILGISERNSTFNSFINNYKVENIILKSIYSDKLNIDKLLKGMCIEVKTAKKQNVFNDFDSFLFYIYNNKLQFPFIIKANHGSGMNLFINSNVDLNSTNLGKISTWFNYESHLISREFHYSLIEKKVFIEEIIDLNLDDFKIHCYGGIPKVIQVDSNRFINHKRNLYDINWNEIDLEYVYIKSEKKINRPIILDDILEMTTLLAMPFEYVRVDWFIKDTEFFLSEMTFHPEGGVGPFKNRNQDKKFLQILKS